MTTAPVLKAQSLVVGYGGRPVLNDVSIEVHSGEVLCVIGHNGAGKSTLMRSLFGLTRPVSGQILLDGKALAQHVPRVLAANGIALIPSSPSSGDAGETGRSATVFRRGGITSPRIGFPEPRGHARPFRS